MRKLTEFSLLLLMVISAGACAPTNVVSTAQVYDPVDSVQQYTQRVDKVTLSAGNAQEVNSRIHVIDPWPRNVGNTRIPANGDRMANAVYRYRCGKPPPQALPNETTQSNTGSGAGASGSQTTVAAAVVRPGTDCSGAQGQTSVPAR